MVLKIFFLLQNIKFSLERSGAGVFRVSPSGQVLLDYQLDYEDIQEYQLKIYVTDGQYVSIEIWKRFHNLLA